MKRLLFIHAICLLSFFSSKGQSSRDFYDSENYRHTLSMLGRKITFFTSIAQKPAKRLDLGKVYYWYRNNTLSSTQGGYSGKLLDGLYSEFYENKSLKEQGLFRSGLKEGAWKTWTESGTLISLRNYDAGILSGPFYDYTTRGALAKQGTYKSGKLHGKVSSYISTDSTATDLYKEGKLQRARTRESLLKKFFDYKKQKRHVSQDL